MEAKEGVKEIKETKLVGNPPSVPCPYCRHERFGWSLKEKLPKIEKCNACGRFFKVVAS